MAYIAIPPAGGSGSGTPSTVLSRAQSLLGTTLVVVTGTDMEQSSWYTTTGTAGTGAVSNSATDRAGVVTLTSGGTNSGLAKLRPIGLGTVVKNPTTDKWYLRSRFRMDTGIDANAYVGVGMADATAGAPAYFVGALGSRSTANYAYDMLNNAGGAAGSGSLGVALDTATFHIFEIWGDTVNFYAAIDGTQVLSLAIPATMTNSCMAQFFVTNGATSAARSMGADDLWTAVVPA